MEQLNSPLGIKIGTDLVLMTRYEKLIDNEAFLKRVFTDKERALYDSLSLKRRKLEFLCGRYACKEAYSKAKGTGIGETSFHDIEILKASNGRPYCEHAEVSISHDGNYTIAMVLIHE